MHRSLLYLTHRWMAVCGMLLLVTVTNAQVTVYQDRTLFTAALTAQGLSPTSDDFESYALGPIALGDVRGDFRYTFDPALTQPAVVPGGNGGQALGGSPFDVFAGGDSVMLTAGAGSVVRAFGADFLYAPSFDTIPADTYRLGIADGTAAGQFAGNADSIDPNGGAFFLGVIADPGAEFTGVRLFSVQQDPNFLVPAYQADNLLYAGVIVPATPSVPEPETLPLFILGGMALLARTRRHR
jgi:hypothetical protein